MVVTETEVLFGSALAFERLKSSSGQAARPEMAVPCLSLVEWKACTHSVYNRHTCILLSTERDKARDVLHFSSSNHNMLF